MITSNEKKVLRFLLAALSTDYSINEIAKRCHLAPNGAYEILKKLEKLGVVTPKKIANVRSYAIDFASKEATKLLELILVPDYKTPRIRYRYNDLKEVEKVTQLCVIFGSYVQGKTKPNDIDILFVIKKKDYGRYTKMLDSAKGAIPLKVHDVIQTKTDLIKNIRKKEKLIMNILSHGIVLWGHEFLVEVIKRAAQEKT